MRMTIEAMQVFGNEKRLILLFKNLIDKSGDVAYILKLPIVEQVNLTKTLDEPIKIEMKMFVMPENLTIEQGKNLMYDTFDNYTIKELFKIINRKIDRR